MSINMIMQEHYSQCITDICPLFLFAIQRFFTRVCFYLHFLQAILLTRSCQRFINLQITTKQQARMFFSFREDMKLHIKTVLFLMGQNFEKI